MHILVTNDDGIDAPGLAALVEAARPLGELIIIAPDCHRSGCSHAATSDQPLRLVERGPRHFTICGTPVDCVRVALLQVEPRIDLVLSGINDGANLGVDVLMSGTVAAAREAALLGRRAVALSQYRRRGSRPIWSCSSQRAADVLSHLLRQSCDTQGVWNVNLPDIDAEEMPPMREAPIDWHPLPIRYEPVDGMLNYVCDYHHRPRAPGSDVDECFSGRIAISRLPVRG